jgi:hypothetical protein
MRWCPGCQKSACPETVAIYSDVATPHCLAVRTGHLLQLGAADQLGTAVIRWKRRCTLDTRRFTINETRATMCCRSVTDRRQKFRMNSDKWTRLLQGTKLKQLPKALSASAPVKKPTTSQPQYKEEENIQKGYRLCNHRLSDTHATSCYRASCTNCCTHTKLLTSTYQATLSTHTHTHAHSNSTRGEFQAALKPTSSQCNVQHDTGVILPLRSAQKLSRLRQSHTQSDLSRACRQHSERFSSLTAFRNISASGTAADPTTPVQSTKPLLTSSE